MTIEYTSKLADTKNTRLNETLKNPLIRAITFLKSRTQAIENLTEKLSNYSEF